MANQPLSVRLAYRGGSVKYWCFFENGLFFNFITNTPPAAEAERWMVFYERIILIINI